MRSDDEKSAKKNKTPFNDFAMANEAKKTPTLSGGRLMFKDPSPTSLSSRSNTADGAKEQAVLFCASNAVERPPLFEAPRPVSLFPNPFERSSQLETITAGFRAYLGDKASHGCKPLASESLFPSSVAFLRNRAFISGEVP
jgi:hypothetical protein